MIAATTIYIRTDLKETLASLKRYEKESYNDVIQRLADMAIDDEPLSDETIKGLEEALEEIKAGQYLTQEEIMEKHGFPCQFTK
jgi:predicted CopG family antitoxin